MRVLVTTLCFLFSLLPFAAFAACTSPVISLPPSLKTDEKKSTGPIAAGRSLLWDFFTSMGITPTMGPKLPWARMLVELEAGNIDVIAPILKTPAREKKLVYTNSWASDRHGIIVHKDNVFDYASLKDLDNLRGVYLNGAAFPHPYRGYIKTNPNLTPVHSLHSLSKMLDQKRIQYVLAPLGSVFEAIPLHMRDGRFVILPGSVISTPLYIAFSRKSPCKELIPQLNAYIQKTRIMSN